MENPASVSFTFRPRHRLTHAREFQAVYAGNVRKQRGVLALSALPNTFEHPRLGLAVSSRIGNAPTRNRWKRLLREAFRLQQHTLPRSPTGGYDLVLSVRATRGHTIWTLPACIKTLSELALDADREWRRRDRRAADPFSAPHRP